MPYYKSGKSIMRVACYDGGKLIIMSLIIIKIRLIGHMVNHMLDHMLDHILDHVLNDILDHVLDQIIIGFVNKTLQLPFILA